MSIKLYAQPEAGQELRGAGTWERATNAQQKKLVRAYDEWSVSVRKEILKATARRASKNELALIVDRRILELESKLLEVMRTGVLNAAIVSVGKEHANDPAVLSAQNKQIMENNQLVKGALIPNIHLALRNKLLEIDTRELKPKDLIEAFEPMRVRTAQYAGGFWVMIFNVQQSAGIELERQRKEQGLPVEPVRWVLDPAAEHCNPSPGYFGCIELKGEYPNGWSSLPTVPAGQVTCRGNCILPSNNIDITNIQAMTRAYYSGLAIKLITQSGVQFSITANHPILTPMGWVKAKLLHKGDYVINSTYSKRPMFIVDNNHQDIPAFIEQIWDSLSMIPIINTCPSSIVMPDDFHGDGRFMYGNIDIIFIDSQLRSDVFYSTVNQFINYNSFHRGLLTECLLPSNSSFMQIDFSSLATLDSFMVSRNLVNSLFGCHSRPFNYFGFTTSSNMDSLSFESMLDSTSTYPKIFRQLQDTFSRLVSLDKIVDIVYFNYSGHVYDLQTDCGYYILNSSIEQRQGIVNSNCRCHLEVFKNGKWQRGVF